MKKTLKIVIPILVVLVLLAVGYWFFFRYRIDLTTSLLRNFADSQLEGGHYSTAIRCYRWASELDPGDVETSLKLAQAYRGSGNYSKTESVLVHAIYETPEDIRLYELLSQVYVEQDKLLDAQQMLDGVTQPEIRSRLDAERPQAPVAEPAGDFYSDYITVELQFTAGDRCCFTVDGSFPSLEGDRYAEPIQIPGGQTTIRALTVNEAGLVSTALNESYTIAGVIEEVEFHDEALLTQMRELLDRPSRPIRSDDLWSIEELTLPQAMTNSEDLRWFTGLNKLVGMELGELDYSFLSSMPELRYLELENCVVSAEALAQIAACPKLEVLILANCGLSNLEPLSALTTLRVLDLSDNTISSIAPIAGMESLEELYLGHNALTRLSSMQKLSALRILDLSYNALDYVGSVSACTGLERLNLSHNRLGSVTALSALKSLVWLNASNNNVTDVSVLAPCTELESFLMTDNKLQSVDFLSGCAKIREVNIDYNDVLAAPQFQKDCPLERFSAAHNFLEDLSGLSGLQQLSVVNADYNNIRDIDVLKDCPNLSLVNVYNTYIRSGGVLAENGVTVNFTPSF